MAIDVSSMTDDELRAHLHGETGKLPWVDLQKHFARGVVFKVEVGLDIIDVAMKRIGENHSVGIWMLVSYSPRFYFF